MKNRICAVAMACICLVMIAGCGKSGGAIRPITEGFTCQVDVSYQELSLQGKLSRDAQGKLLLTFDKPTSLSGVSIGWDGEKMSMELAGASIAVKAEKVPQGALIKSLLRVLSAVKGTGEVTPDGYVITGEVEQKAYTLVCDPETGFLTSLSVPEDSLSATFSQVQALSAEENA